MTRRTNYNKGDVIFNNSLEGWSKGRLFFEWCALNPDQRNLEVYNDYAEANPEKYKAWRTWMRITYGDKFEDIPLSLLGEVGE